MHISLRYLAFLLCFGFLVNAEPKKEKKMAVSAKIAIIDVRRIITQDPEGLKHASAEWQDLFNKLQDTLRPAAKEIADLQAQYKKRIADLEALQKSGVSSKDALRKKYEEEVAPLEFQLQNQYQQHERFTYEELNKAQSILGPKIEKAIDSVCDAQGWDFAINREAIPSRRLAKRFDITDDVLQLLNAQYATEKSKKAEASKNN